MKKRLLVIAATAVLTIAWATASNAQAPGPGGPGGPGAPGGPQGMGRGGMMMSPEFRDKFQLMRLQRGITGLQSNPETALTAAQAKKILAVLVPLRSKAKLSSEEAKTAVAKIQKVFTLAQVDAMSQMRPGGQNRGMGQRQGMNGGNMGSGQNRQMGPGGQRPAMNGAGPGQRGSNAGGKNGMRNFDPNMLKDFNPLYVGKPAKDDKMAQDRAQRLNKFFTGLRKIAKDK